MGRFNYSDDDDDMENFEKFSNRGKRRNNEDWGNARYADKQKGKRIAEEKKKYNRRRHVSDDEREED